MPNTFTLISSATLPSNTATYTINSIPQTFTHLKLLLTPRMNSSNDQAVWSYLNSNTGTKSGQYFIRNSGNTAAASYANGYIGSAIANTYTAGFFGLSEVTFGNYKTSESKNYITHNAAQSDNTTTAYMNLISQQSTDTNPITSITITVAGDMLLAGTKYWLYGISN